jgi:hypothetical protein
MSSVRISLILGLSKRHFSFEQGMDFAEYNCMLLSIHVQHTPLTFPIDEMQTWMATTIEVNGRNTGAGKLIVVDSKLSNKAHGN